MCVVVPVPLEAKFTLVGFALAYSISSLIVLYGASARATTRSAVAVIFPMGAKSSSLYASGRICGDTVSGAVPV
jgi:hypothetical protein